MSKPTHVELFPKFQMRGRGIPYLAVWRKRKTSHIHWGEGTLRDYAKFKDAVDDEMMCAELEEVWRRYLPQAGRNASASFNGGVGGVACYVPHEMATALQTIVKRHYDQALRSLDPVNHEHSTSPSHLPCG